ncbi:MAG: xanthine dehydrogenase family protein molybdopterin-binding subunit, partial [Candidatus Rokuibacteriota bacterium]
MTGQGQYVADLAPPGTLHAAFVRSPHAHAAIRHVETSRARGAAGVSACVTAADLAGRLRPLMAPSRMKTYRPTEFPVLALDTVRYVGEIVAVVVAESRYAAEDALDLIEAEYAPLPVIADVEKALAPSSPLVHEAATTNTLL